MAKRKPTRSFRVDAALILALDDQAHKIAYIADQAGCGSSSVSRVLLDAGRRRKERRTVATIRETTSSAYFGKGTPNYIAGPCWTIEATPPEIE